MKAAQPFALFNLIGELISGWRAIASALQMGARSEEGGGGDTQGCAIHLALSPKCHWIAWWWVAVGGLLGSFLPFLAQRDN